MNKRRNIYLNRSKRRAKKRKKKAIKENVFGFVGTVILTAMFLLPFIAKILGW